MPNHRRYSLLELGAWMRGKQVTTGEMAAYLGCHRNYIYCRVLPYLDSFDIHLAEVGQRKTKGMSATVFEVMRPDENWRDK